MLNLMKRKKYVLQGDVRRDPTSARDKRQVARDGGE